MEPKISGMTDLFSKSIGIAEPWYIRSIETQDAEVHVYVDIREGNFLPCPVCGEMCRRAGYEKEERMWRHGDCLFYPCYVHCKRPRIVCDEHKTRVVDAPWARKSSRFTLMFEGYAMLILADMPIRKVSRLLRCNEKSLVKIMRHWVGRAVENDDLSDVRSIAIDETSFKRGQSYVTIIIDALKKRVIDVEEGRSAEQIEAFSRKLEAKGGDCTKITAVSSDMSAAYRSGINMCFAFAKHTVDKFHVKKLVLDGMDEVRRREQKQLKGARLAQCRRTLMIPNSRQSEEQHQRVIALVKQYPKTGRAYRMVQALDTIYSLQKPEEAAEELKKLYRWMRRSRLEPMKKVALTLKNYASEILNYFLSKLTNAICEGINSMIQAAKRKARGYNTVEGYAMIIYLIAGKFQLACPNPLRLLE